MNKTHQKRIVSYPNPNYKKSDNPRETKRGNLVYVLTELNALMEELGCFENSDEFDDLIHVLHTAMKLTLNVEIIKSNC